ncbi:MAG: hypothetical protein DRJ46_04535 [Thermoprotei archaeon]|nr:MAG: hypothetical protein DRJ46_04535 [Thermoprotei archaeon]
MKEVLISECNPHSDRRKARDIMDWKRAIGGLWILAKPRILSKEKSYRNIAMYGNSYVLIIGKSGENA